MLDLNNQWLRDDQQQAEKCDHRFQEEIMVVVLLSSGMFFLSAWVDGP